MRAALIGLLVGTYAAPALAQGAESAPVRPSDPPVIVQPSAEAADLRELLEAARETAKATREGVDYGRVVPDLLTQILTKLDKIENKLDKIESARLSGWRKNAS
jgi:hypothetical protein